MTADDSPPPKRRRWYRSFSLRALLLLTASVALVLAFIVLPREHRRRAMNSLNSRGVVVELTQDPTDLMLAAVQGHDDWEEPSWTTVWLHRNLPHSYLRPVSAVYFRKSHTPVKEDFQEIGRLGAFEALFFEVPIEHSEHLQPLIASDNVNDYLYFGHHAVNSESLGSERSLIHFSRLGTTSIAHATQAIGSPPPRSDGDSGLEQGTRCNAKFG